METIDIKKVIERLNTVPEFSVLKQELDNFSKMLYNISDIDGRDKSIPFEVEVRARFIAAQRVEQLLRNWNVLGAKKQSSQTYE